jgi:hypothetical protein
MFESPPKRRNSFAYLRKKEKRPEGQILGARVQLRPKSGVWWVNFEKRSQ